MGEHINTFSKGMTSDMNIMYQPEGTYRYMKNCSLISQDGDNFVIKDCVGNIQLFTINIRYVGITTGPTAVTYDVIPMIIGFISFPNKLVVLSTNDETEGGGYGEIGIINYLTYGEGIQPLTVSGETNAGYVPLYNHASLHFTKLRKVEGFGYEENDAVQRVYWTDNLNEPRVINVADPIFTTVIASGSLVFGQQYMITEGVIEHPVASGVYYGPSSGAGNIVGSVFTAASTTYTDMLTPSPTAKVIKYFPIQLLDFTPSRLLGNIEFKKYGTGTVYCGSKIYFYRLTNVLSGIKTSWSYGSSPIHVGTENSPIAQPANAYFDFAGGGSTTALLNSGRSVFITINNIDLAFTGIEVACAEFDQIKETPRVINIVAITPITGASMDIEHTGSNNLGELTLSDITLFPASILKCKTLTTNKNYILIGNITERAEFSVFDKTLATISQIKHRMPVHEYENGAINSAQVCNNVLSYTSVSPSTAVNPAAVGGIAPYTQWIVIGASSVLDFVTYNGVNYGDVAFYPAGPVFEGALTFYNYSITEAVPGTVTVRPCVSRNKYTSITGTYKRPEWIQFDAANSNDWSYKNPAVASHVRGLWSNQTYRYGVLFYDLKGNPFYVRHLGDFTTAAITDSYPSNTIMHEVTINAGGDKDWYINQNGVSISGITIPASIIDLISGFSVVRAERDATIMSQGMLMQTDSDTAVSGGITYPTCSPNIRFPNSLWQEDRVQLFTYICPDKLVDYPINNYAAGSKISTSHWVKPRDFFATGYNMKSSLDGPEATETKYFDELTTETIVTPERGYKISAITDVSENSSVANFGIGNHTFVNITQFMPFAGNVVDGTCTATPLPNLSLTTAAGGMRTLVEVDGAVYAYDRGNVVPGLVWYGDLNANFPEMDYKMMANVTVEKSNLYGGTNDDALANTLYFSTGHFQPITAAVKADTLSGGNYVFNNVEIYGGDCFTCLVDYGHSLYNSGAGAGTVYASHSWGLKFACQCNSNYDLRRGRTVSNNRMYAVGTALTNSVSYKPANIEGFSYNKGYSTEGIQFAYPALPVNYSQSGQFKFRIRYGGEKFPGETTDSYRVFNVQDYKDTDGHGGEINNLKTKDGRTIVFQNKSIDTVPILERQVVSGQSGESTTIGTGGVVDRFDSLSSYFGNQHQWGVTETEYGFAWFDMRRKAFLALDFNSGIQELSQINGLKGFFDEVFLEVLGNTSATTNVLNSQTYDKTSDRPLIGVGIIGVYDPKFKTTYLTFKFKSRSPNNKGAQAYINKDFTIMYYHPRKMFIGFTDWTPGNVHNHNQTVLSSNTPLNKTKYFGVNMGATIFYIGNVVSYLNKEYVCIADVMISTFPGSPADRVPGYPASTYWYLINQTNQIWVHNQPKSWPTTPAPDYDYSKFFGLVVDNEVTFVILPETKNQFSVLNMEQGGNNVNVTDIYTETQYDTASDLNISATSRFYRWIYSAICSSLPLNSKGIRLTDEYLQVRLYKKNWSIQPYDRSKAVKILERVRSFFVEKR